MFRNGSVLHSVGLATASMVAKLLLAAQIVIAFAFHAGDRETPLVYTGYVLLAVAVILGGIAFVSLYRRGGARRRVTPLATTIVVDQGIYGIVRHPMFLIAMIMAVALMLIGQHLVVIAMGFVEIIILCFAIIWEERNSRKKFGEAYDRYARSVPALNLAVGLTRYMRKSH
ncbi:MAG: isoprenylcysteine carboxylmethyltransferase family protein [Dehalococcoidia bacterium]